MYQGVKEELAWAIDKQFQYFLVHYPTRKLHQSYRLTFSYPNSFSIRMHFVNEKYTDGQITEGLLYGYLFTKLHNMLQLFLSLIIYNICCDASFSYVHV